MKSATHAMEFEMPVKAKIKPSKRVTRSWAIKDTEKHLERLSTARIAFYLIKRHSTFLSYVALGGCFFVAGLMA